MHEDRSIIDPFELSADELAEYLKDLLDRTEELNSSAIEVHVHDGIAHLVGEVPDEMQRDLAQMLVLDVVPEELIANDLTINPDLDANPPEEPAEQAVTEFGEQPMEVERDDTEEAAQEGKPYEPPTAPRPEPPHKEGID